MENALQATAFIDSNSAEIINFATTVIGKENHPTQQAIKPVSYTHLTLPTNREV